MLKIFSPLNKFSTQTKKEWIKKFLSENTTNKLEDIQHKINNEVFDPIYFNDEVKVKNTFFKKKNWDQFVTHKKNSLELCFIFKDCNS